jgi:hypothetical protein
VRFGVGLRKLSNVGQPLDGRVMVYAGQAVGEVGVAGGGVVRGGGALGAAVRVRAVCMCLYVYVWSVCMAGCG